MCAHFSISKQCQISCCYTYGLLSAGATEGELPEGQEKEPWVRPQRTVSNDLQTFNRRGGHWPPTQHSAIAFIFHSPFSILHSAHAQFKQTAKRAVSRPLFFIPKHQHAPFSEQNLTSLPSRIIFVVRTAHILPHIEQV